ncbi:MAG: hypothetical protein Q9157_005284 [Trypethelium eluteriae]
MEAIVKGQNEKAKNFPRIITCPNEMVALSIADGYARVTNKPQAVIIHVDVGTQGLGAAVHNASCGRAPVLIFAGLSPCTIEGEYRGSRTEYIHWLQDIPDQKQIVAQYCRYTGEIKRGRNVKQLVNRALNLATSDPKDPVYLVGSREAMEEEIEPYTVDQSLWTPAELGALKHSQLQQVSELLVDAQEPLVIAGYVGRNQSAVDSLVELANTIKGLRVLDTTGSDMCFPADHPAWLGLKYGEDESIRTADAILVLDCDVPWINTQCHPRKGAKIIHIDVDPLKHQMPVFYIDAIARFRADPESAISQITSYVRTHLQDRISTQTFDRRWLNLQQKHQQRIEGIASKAIPGENGTFDCPFLISQVRKACPPDTIWAVEAVTNSVIASDQIQATIPGSWINCGGGGLGWSGGGALGIKLATDAQAGGTNKGKFVCQIVGDGSYLFSVPGSVYWIAQSGDGSKVSNEDLHISFAPTPDYAGIAKAAAGGKAWAHHADTVADLQRLLPEAVKAVKSGICAVLDAHLGGPQGKFEGDSA